jgi:hypothetical protein
VKVASNDFAEIELTSWLESPDSGVDRIASLLFIPLGHLVKKAGWPKVCIIRFIQE